MTLNYDPTGLDPANLITGEVHPLGVSDPAGIIPLEGAFFAADLVVEGTPTGGGALVTIDPLTGYTLSPMNLMVSIATGKEVFSYVVIQDPASFESITITYRGVGCQPDATLFAEINAADNPDLTDPTTWAQFKGQEGVSKPYAIDPSIRGLNFFEAMAVKFTDIIAAMGSTSASMMVVASQAVRGITRYADSAEVAAGVKENLAISPKTLKDALSGIIVKATGPESKTTNNSLAVTPLGVTQAMRRDYVIDSINGTNLGGSDGVTFDTLKNAIGHSITGGVTTITFNEDIYLPDELLFVTRKSIVLRGSSSSRKIIRSDGTLGCLLLTDNTTLRISRCTFEWGDSTGGGPSSQSPIHVGLNSSLFVAANAGDGVDVPVLTSLPGHTIPFVYVGINSFTAITDTVINGNGGGHNLLYNAGLPCGFHGASNTVTDINVNYNNGYHDS